MANFAATNHKYLRHETNINHLYSDVIDRERCLWR